MVKVVGVRSSLVQEKPAIQQSGIEPRFTCKIKCNLSVSDFYKLPSNRSSSRVPFHHQVVAWWAVEIPPSLQREFWTERPHRIIHTSTKDDFEDGFWEDMGRWEKDGDAGEECGEEELGVDVSKLDAHLLWTFKKDRGRGIPVSGINSRTLCYYQLEVKLTCHFVRTKKISWHCASTPHYIL